MRAFKHILIPSQRENEDTRTKFILTSFNIYIWMTSGKENNVIPKSDHLDILRSISVFFFFFGIQSDCVIMLYNSIFSFWFWLQFLIEIIQALIQYFWGYVIL